MKSYIIFCIIIFNSFFFLKAEECKIVEINNMTLMESVITIQSTISLNPMYANHPSVLNDNGENAMFIANLDNEIFLEQYSEISNTFSCPIQSVTLVLSKEQRQILAGSKEDAYQIYEITGLIRWSESSLELAGNAVLSDVSKINRLK